MLPSASNPVVIINDCALSALRKLRSNSVVAEPAAMFEPEPQLTERSISARSYGGVVGLGPATPLHAMNQTIHTIAPPATTLSKAETEVIRLIWDGLRAKEVAAAIHIAPQTVAVHLFNIRTKLGVRTTIQACARAITLGIIIDDIRPENSLTIPHEHIPT